MRSFLLDQIIELGMYYLSEWENTAIANMHFSVALSIFAFLVGAFLMSLLKRKTVANLKRQLASQTDSLEQVNSKQEELLKKQKSDAAQLSVHQQQTEQLMTDLQESKSSYDELQQHEQQLNKTLDAKIIEADKFKASLSEKTGAVVQLQAELQEQKEKVMQSALDLEKMLATEKEASQAVSELNLVKQQVVQLESELNDKNIQIGKSGASINNSQARVLELEQQLQNSSLNNDLKNGEEVTALIHDGTQSEGIVDKVFSLFNFDNVGTEKVADSNDISTSSADKSSPEAVNIGVQDTNDILESVEYVQGKVKDLFKKIKI